jgi:glycosyltransferase involved in cell wall biosynthesis
MAQAAARNVAAWPASSRIAVGVATRGRPEYVRLLVERLRRQTLRPTVVLVAYVEAADVAALQATPELRLIRAEAGLTRQRNAILRGLPAAVDFIAFFDDDFLPHPQWLARTLAAFDAAPDIVCVTGNVLANGVSAGEIDASTALDLLERTEPEPSDAVENDVSPYGCNMAFRRARVGDLRFDEALPLYGWLEDRDFAARVGGRQVRLTSALGVHLGVGAGRMSDRRLGYAQIANPLYLLRRGTMRPGDVLRRVLIDLASNLCKAPGSPARRRRLIGNARALAEALAGRCRPERAAAL